MPLQQNQGTRDSSGADFRGTASSKTSVYVPCGELDAITGSSNFDIAEYIWVKLLTEFSDRPVTIAMICKTQVARNILLHCARRQLPVTGSSLRMIDAKKWFAAGVDACWFSVELGPGKTDYTAQAFPSIDASQPDSRIGVVDGQLVADVDAYERSKHFDSMRGKRGMR